jgi:hypothetical protein
VNHNACATRRWHDRVMCFAVGMPSLVHGSGVAKTAHLHAGGAATSIDVAFG